MLAHIAMAIIIFCYPQELLYNIDPLTMKYGERKPGSPFDNRIQAALRAGDYKIITGMVLGAGWYKPVYSEGTVEFHLLLFFPNNPHALENLLPFLNWFVYLANSGHS